MRKVRNDELDARHENVTREKKVTDKKNAENEEVEISGTENADVKNAATENCDTAVYPYNESLCQHHQIFLEEALPHMNALYNSALRFTGDADDASDLLQETYLKAYRFFDRFERGTNCRAWLFRIMRNSFINVYRKGSKEPEKVDYDAVEEYFHAIRHESTDPNDLEEKLFSNLLDDDVSAALDSLPEEFRTIVILCDIEEFTYEEISEFVECPIGTVRSRLHRGRKLLRAALFEYAAQRGFSRSDSPEET